MKHSIDRPAGATQSAYALPRLLTVQSRHGQLNYRESGAGPPVFFLHGMNGQSASWLHQFIGLADSYRLIAWDAPGYGKSDSCGPSIDELARAGRELLDTVGARQTILIGHSMGGVIAGRMAINYPDMFAGLVLSCSHWGWGDPVGKPLRSRYADRIRELESLGIEEYAKLRASKMVGEHASAEVVRFLRDLSKAVTRGGLESVGRANQEADNRPGLAGLGIPLYVLQAEHDRVIKSTRTEELLDTLPNATLIRLPGVGHAPYVEDSGGYNRVIRTTLEQILRTKDSDTPPNS